MISKNTKRFIVDLFSSLSKVSIDSGFVAKRYNIKYLGTVIPVIKHQEIVKAKDTSSVIVSP